MEQNKEKINKFSKGVVTASKVGKIFSIIGIVGCVIALIFIAITAFAFDPMVEYIKAHPETLGNIEINIGESGNIILIIADKITLGELVDNKPLMMNMLGSGAIECVEGLISCVITLVLMNLVKGMFEKLEKAESPFNTELNSDLKKSFIAITILVLFNASWIIALIVGLMLAVVYYLYQYGASLQKDVDETI